MSQLLEFTDQSCPQLTNLDEYIGKPSLENLADENLLDIIRYLIFNHDTVAFGPPNEHEDGTPRRSLGILGVSKRLSAIASSVLYGENVFVVSEDCILYHRYSVCVSSLSLSLSLSLVRALEIRLQRYFSLETLLTIHLLTLPSPAPTTAPKILHEQYSPHEVPPRTKSQQ